jgi:hypothetical protein
MARIALTPLLATLGWWMGILLGSTIGGVVGIFASPIAGRIVGGLLAGLIRGAAEGRGMPSMRVKRLRCSFATAVTSAILAVLLLDVQVLPWLVGGVFGAAVALAQAGAVRLPARASILRAGTSAAAWSIGFVLLHAGGACGKLGVIAPGFAVVLLAVASAMTSATANATNATSASNASNATKSASSDVRLASGPAILS